MRALRRARQAFRRTPSARARSPSISARDVSASGRFARRPPHAARENTGKSEEGSMRVHISHPPFTRATVVVAWMLAACADSDTSITAPDPEFRRSTSSVECDADNGGITLPPGFCAVVVADLVDAGRPALARHMAVTPTGDLFVAINSPRNNQPTFGIVGLRDRDGDGRADEQSRFSAGLGGSGIAWGEASLYFGANDRVLRFRLPAVRLTPVGESETVVSGLPSTGDH